MPLRDGFDFRHVLTAMRKLRTEHPATWNHFIESHHLNHLDSDGHEDTENRAACPICRILDGKD